MNNGWVGRWGQELNIMLMSKGCLIQDELNWVSISVLAELDPIHDKCPKNFELRCVKNFLESSVCSAVFLGHEDMKLCHE